MAVASFISNPEFQSKYGAYCSAYFPGYANPLSFSTTPNVAGGVPTTLTVTYASSAGSADITNGYVQIDGCNIEWDRNTGDVTGSNGNCTIHSQSNASVIGNPNALAVQFNITFAEGTFLGAHEVYSWATNAEGLQSPSVDLGALMVNQGPDFTLTSSLSGLPPYNLPLGANVTITFNLTRLNGLTDDVDLTLTPASGGGLYNCFPLPQVLTFTGSTTQQSITLRNGCLVGNMGGIVPTASSTTVNHTLPTLYFVSVSLSGPDFTISGPSTASTLTYQGPVYYTVTLQSTNYQSGYVDLSVAAAPGTPWPAGVGASFTPSTVYLPAGNPGTPATSTLKFTNSATMPGGSFSLLITATLETPYQQHTSALILPTQVISFTASAAPAIKNNSKGIQLTLTPSAPLPPITTCDANLDPTVQCTAQNNSNGTVTVTITNTNAMHGARLFRFNGGALTTLLNVRDDIGSMIGDIADVVAGQTETVPFSVGDVDGVCQFDGLCPSVWVDVGGPSWVTAAAMDLNDFQITLSPPLDTAPGPYLIPISVCAGFDAPDLEDEATCAFPVEVVWVEAAPPPPCVPSIGILPSGSTTNIAETKQTVAAGQIVALYASIINSCSQVVQQYSWTVDGSIASDWQGVGPDGQPTGRQPDDHSAGPPLAPPRNAAAVTFAWTNDGTDKRANIKAIFADGSTATEYVTFNISVPVVTATMNAGGIYADTQSLTYPGRFALYHGMNFAGTNPQPPDGDYEWVQVVNSAVIRRHDSTGWYRLTLSGLDTNYPYADQPLNTRFASDQPTSPLTVGYDQLTRSDDFTMYLMFRPSAPPLGATTSSNIWVPLNGYEWKWSAAAQSSDGGNTWTLVPNSTSSDPPNTSGRDLSLPRLTTYPTWTANAGDQLTNWIKEN